MFCTACRACAVLISTFLELLAPGDAITAFATLGAAPEEEVAGAPMMPGMTPASAVKPGTKITRRLSAVESAREPGGRLDFLDMIGRLVHRPSAGARNNLYQKYGYSSSA
jgi:hypothetical protein